MANGTVDHTLGRIEGSLQELSYSIRAQEAIIDGHMQALSALQVALTAESRRVGEMEGKHAELLDQQKRLSQQIDRIRWWVVGGVVLGMGSGAGASQLVATLMGGG